MNYNPVLLEFAIQLAHVAWPPRGTTVRNMERMMIVYGLNKEQKKLYEEVLVLAWKSQETAIRKKHIADQTIPHQVIDLARDYIHGFVN